MLDTRQFGEELKRLGYRLFTGVPCSFLKSLINYAINDCEYICATNEGDAVAIASGAYLGGKKSVVLMQNSGLANAVSPLTSLNYTFKLPVLGFVSLRGEEGLSDEPQHELMGQITTRLLDLMEVKWEYLSKNLDEAKEQLQRAENCIENNSPFFFVVQKGTFAQENLCKVSTICEQKQVKIEKGKADQLPKRIEALEVIQSCQTENTIAIATTGKTGRELFELGDAPNQFYMVGSMGCVSSFGLGLANAQQQKKIIVIDGDGSLLMRMGNLPLIGTYQPANLLHILLDNQAYDSTGGQKTLSSSVDFIEMAAACGYINVVYVHSLQELQQAIERWKNHQKLSFLYLKISEGSKKDLGRPTIMPPEVKKRLQVFLNGE